MSFFDDIYTVVKKIPEGTVSTYGQIALLAGKPKAARAVGYALHANPEPGIIPCHRVVNRHGRLAECFAFGGIQMQKVLLEKEGVEVGENGVDIKKYLWDGNMS